MSIFGILKCDDKVFTGDKIRFVAGESFLAPGTSFATVSHEISVDGGTTWYDISQKKQVDWIFATAGVKTIELRISSTEPASASVTKDVTVVDLTAQKLFSLDNDLYTAEPDIDQYLPKKWSSWNTVHLKAQEYIMDWLDEKKILNSLGKKYVVADLLDIQEVKQFSLYKCLEFIFEGNTNIVGDLSSVKRDKYREMANEKASRSQIAINYDGTGTTVDPTRTDLHSITLVRG